MSGGSVDSSRIITPTPPVPPSVSLIGIPAVKSTGLHFFQTLALEKPTRILVSESKTLPSSCYLFFKYFFGGLECAGHSFAYVTRRGIIPYLH
jgi:hypothetical protein